jgi:hypothetical protein
VARKPSPFSRLQPADGEIDVVVHDEERLGLDLEEAGGRGDRLARLVHVRLRLEQRDAALADARLRDAAVELRLPGAAVPPRQLVDDHPAGVVPVALVPAARVPEARDE